MTEIIEAIDRLNSTIRRQNHILMEAHGLCGRREYSPENEHKEKDE